MSKLTKVRLHGNLGDLIGKKEWELDVKSGAEALHAINCQTGDGIKKFFLKTEKSFFQLETIELELQHKIKTQCLVK